VSDPALTVLSTFTGVGGLDLGLESAGFAPIGCVEIDETARRSLKLNRPEWPLLEPGDLQVLAESLEPEDVGLRQGELTLLAGAPPCQPYSKAALWAPTAWNGLADARATPLHAFLTLVHRFLPRCIVLENVPGFVRGHHSALPVLLSALDAVNQSHGTTYVLHQRVIRAEDYGVPQRRQRAIVIAFRDGFSPAWPEPTHAEAPLSAWDALHGIGEPEEELRVAGKWADLLPSIPEGRNYLWHTNRGGGKPIFGYRTRYWSFLLKLAKAEPAWTIPAQPGPSIGPFHWLNRPLAVPELLRLQTLPPEWVVEGKRREQILQVGNATPSLLGERLGRAIAARLGAEVPRGTLRHRIERAQHIPPPEPVHPVPARYKRLVGDHPDHPGTGLGPKPRPAR
jgi:DNA (cytosine-5)-methyltransferase 1